MIRQSGSILVTGGTGFIGGSLIAELPHAGWDVHLLSRRGLPALPGTKQHLYDGSYASILTAIDHIRPRCVVHLASHFLASHQGADVSDLVQANITFGTQLVEAMTKFEVRHLVCTGTAWQHANDQDYEPMGLYAATKQAFETVLRYFTVSGSISAMILRIYDSAGPTDPRKKLFYALNRARINGHALDMSPGHQILNLLHVDDLTQGLVHAIQVAVGSDESEQRYAIRHHEEWTLREIVQGYQRETGGFPIVNWGALPYRPREIMRPPRIPEALPGWTPRYSVAQTVLQIARAQLAASDHG